MLGQFKVKWANCEGGYDIRIKMQIRAMRKLEAELKLRGMALVETLEDGTQVYTRDPALPCKKFRRRPRMTMPACCR